MSGFGVIPSWYLPKGMVLPPHVEFRDVCQGLVVGAGPDVDAHTDTAKTAPPGGGLIYGGGGYTRGQTGWVKTSAGYWVNFTRCLPEQLQRASAHRRIVNYKIVEGAGAGQDWLIPVMCRPIFGRGKEDQPARSFVSALDPVWGPKGWQDPQDLTPIHGRLVAVARDVRSLGAGFQPLMDLAVDLIGLTHHSLGLSELEATGWITQGLLIRIFTAAVGLEPTGG